MSGPLFIGTEVHAPITPANHRTDIERDMDAEVIWVIGANPTVNHPVAATFIKNAAKQGAKLFVMKFAFARKSGDSYAPFMRGRFVHTQPLYQRPPTQIEFVGVEEHLTCI